MSQINSSQFSVLTSALQKADNSQKGITAAAATFKQFLHVPDQCVAAFLEAFKAAPKSKTVSFLYVMNDVAQVRKQFRKAFEMQMKAILTTAMRKDNKCNRTILKLVGIWRDRAVFIPDVLSAATRLAQGVRVRTSTSDSSSRRSNTRKSSLQTQTQKTAEEEANILIAKIDRDVRPLEAAIVACARCQATIESSQNNLKVIPEAIREGNLPANDESKYRRLHDTELAAITKEIDAAIKYHRQIVRAQKKLMLLRPKLKELLTSHRAMQEADASRLCERVEQIDKLTLTLQELQATAPDQDVIQRSVTEQRVGISLLIPDLPKAPVEQTETVEEKQIRLQREAEEAHSQHVWNPLLRIYQPSNVNEYGEADDPDQWRD